MNKEFESNFNDVCSQLRLKPETVNNVLILLKKLGRVSAFDFSNAYWPENDRTPVGAHRAGLMFLKKFKKYGLVNVYLRTGGNASPMGKQVFELSELGLSFL